MPPLTRPTLWVSLFLAACAITSPAATSRPNVLIVMTDDQGYGELSVHGNPVLKTPNLAQVRRGVWHLEVAAAGTYAFELRRYPAESGLKLKDAVPETRVTDGVMTAGPAFEVAKARLRVGGQTAEAEAGDESASFTLKLPAGRTTIQTWWLDAAGKEIAGAYYVTVERIEPPASDR